MVEYWSLTPVVAGSRPTGNTKFNKMSASTKCDRVYQGKYFNWSIEPVYHTQSLPVVYMIWLDNIDSYSIHFTYDPVSNIFQIGEHKFLMNNIVEAEEILKKFIDVNGSVIPFKKI